MQNVKFLTDKGGCSQYVCNNISKNDEQNYVVVLVDISGKFFTKATFLHNTKVMTSKMGEDKDREKHKKRLKGDV